MKEVQNPLEKVRSVTCERLGKTLYGFDQRASSLPEAVGHAQSEAYVQSFRDGSTRVLCDHNEAVGCTASSYEYGKSHGDNFTHAKHRGYPCIHLKGPLNPVPPQDTEPVITPPSDREGLIRHLGLEDGFANNEKMQEIFQLTAQGDTMPDFEQALRTFTPEMLAAAAQFQDPKLTIVTRSRSFNDLTAAMKRTCGKGVELGETFRDDKSSKGKTENWSAHIIESPADVTPQSFDNPSIIAKERLKAFDVQKADSNINGMNRWMHAHLMMQALLEERLIDVKNWTAFDEDPIDDCPFLVRGGCSGAYNSIYYDVGRTNAVDPYFQLRRSVGGVIPT